MAIFSANRTEIVSDKYLSYFKKNHGCRVVRSRGSNLISKITDLFITDHLTESNHSFQICINDNASSKRAIQLKESNVAILDEGLIATYPTVSVISHFKKTFMKEVNQDLLDSLADCYDVRCIDYIQMSDPDQEVSPVIEVCVPAKDMEDQKRIMNVMIDDFAKSGYFMTSYESVKSSRDHLCVFIQLEAKYTDMLADVNDILYHVSPLKLLKKISVKGLVPYSKSSSFDYPRRVYLFNRCQKDLIYEYAKHKVIQTGDSGFCVFKVKKDVLLNDQLFKDGKQKFYLDPAFSMSSQTDQTALYTYGNIPLRVIEDEFCEVHMNNNGIVEFETMKSLREFRRNNISKR